MPSHRLAIAFVVGGLLGSGLAWRFSSIRGESTTITRLSPDETLRASLVERMGEGRTFQVRIEDLAKGGTRVIFQSPEEGSPHGTERLIWSKDGTKLLLVGRHFFVKDDLFLDNGDQLFYLHEVATGKDWCNSESPVGIPPLGPERIEGVEFTEPVRLKDRG